MNTNAKMLRRPATTSGSAASPMTFTPTPPVLQSVAAITTKSAPLRRSDLDFASTLLRQHEARRTKSP